MKGTFFQKPLEYNVEVMGESWHQGQIVGGMFKVVDHSGERKNFNDLGAHLCHVDIKKMKSGDIKAFHFIESQEIKSGEELEFNFQLSEDCMITEKSKSLYILTGEKEKPLEAGMLQLNIIPTKVISSFIETFENFFRFKFKTLKNKKGYIESKIVPPSTKEWSSIQQINLLMRMQKENLELKLIVKSKKLSFDDGPMQTKDEIVEISRVLSAREHSIYGDSPNTEKMMKIIEEILNKIKLKPLV